VACLAGTGYFQGLCDTHVEQTDRRREDSGREDEGQRRRIAAKDGGKGQEGRRTT
jgi:hypothetical protein